MTVQGRFVRILRSGARDHLLRITQRCGDVQELSPTHGQVHCGEWVGMYIDKARKVHVPVRWSDNDYALRVSLPVAGGGRPLQLAARSFSSLPMLMDGIPELPDSFLEYLEGSDYCRPRPPSSGMQRKVPSTCAVSGVGSVLVLNAMIRSHLGEC